MTVSIGWLGCPCWSSPRAESCLLLIMLDAVRFSYPDPVFGIRSRRDLSVSGFRMRTAQRSQHQQRRSRKSGLCRSRKSGLGVGNPVYVRKPTVVSFLPPSPISGHTDSYAASAAFASMSSHAIPGENNCNRSQFLNSTSFRSGRLDLDAEPESPNIGYEVRGVIPV
jgi:hypothetical protein